MHTTIEKNKHKFTPEMEEKLMYMNDDELFCFFEENTIVYEEPDLLKVILRGKNEANL